MKSNNNHMPAPQNKAAHSTRARSLNEENEKSELNVLLQHKWECWIAWKPCLVYISWWWNERHGMSWTELRWNFLNWKVRDNIQTKETRSSCVCEHTHIYIMRLLLFCEHFAIASFINLADSTAAHIHLHCNKFRGEKQQWGRTPSF